MTLDKDLGLELGRLLRRYVDVGTCVFTTQGKTHLGDSEKALSQGYNVLHLVDGLDAVLDGLGVLSTRAVEDALDAVDVPLCPLLVRRPDDLCNSTCEHLCV